MKYRLGELITAISGYAFKRKQFSENGDIPVIKIKNIESPKIVVDSNTNRISKSLFEKLIRYHVKQNDILISLTGSHIEQVGSMVGKVGMYDQKEPAILNQRVAKLCVKPTNKLDPTYFYYWILRKEVQRLLASQAAGTANQANISVNDIYELEIQLPSLENQIIISNRIKKLDRKIQLNKVQLNNQINDNLIAISKAKWLDLLSSTSTTEVSMNEIAKITMGQSPKSSTYNTNNEGLPLLNGATDFRENINPQRWTSDPKRVVYPNSYIFGVRATIGLTTKVYQKYAIGRGTGAATPINIIYDEFLYFYLEDLFKFYSQTGSGSVYINISKKEFENYKIDVPKISFIEQFHSEINPLFNQIKNNKLQNITLLQIKNDMLNKYFQ